jgi:hypothetical protein
LVRQAGQGWVLWPGYCRFRFDAVTDDPLDLGQDWFIGLDTGWANWSVLYHHVNRGTLQKPRTVFKPYKQGVDILDGPLQWCGSWLHEVGTMRNEFLAADNRLVVAEILSLHLIAARQIRLFDY